MKQAGFAKTLDTLASGGTPFAVATVVRTEGSSIGRPGFKVIISSEGEIMYGSLGGACPESAIAGAARNTMRTGTPKTVKVYLESVDDAVGAVLKNQNENEIHVETNCGGTMEIYIEPYLPQQRLILVGHGGKDDIEDALVKFGKLLDFEVVVVDHSPVLSEQPDLIIKEVDYDLDSFKFSSADSVVVLTHGEGDVDTLRKLSNAKLRYVGMLSSRQRVKEDIAKLKKLGVTEAFITSLRSPVGADIGAVTPAEIALSIMVEVVACKYGKDVLRKTLVQESKFA